MRIVYEMIINSIIFGACYMLYPSVLEKRKPVRRTLLTGWAGFLIYYNVILELLPLQGIVDAYLNTFLAVIGTLWIFCYCFNGTIMLKIAFTLIFMSVNEGSETVAYIVLDILLPPLQGIEIRNSGTMFYITMFFQKLLTFLFCWIIGQVFRKRMITGSKTQLLPVIAAFPLKNYLLGIFWNRMLHTVLTPETTILLCLLLPFLVFMETAYILFYENIIKLKNAKLEIHLSRERDLYRSELLRQYEQNVDDKNKLIHDYKNNILHLTAILDKPESARIYCGELMAGYTGQLHSHQFETNNDVLNMILDKLTYDCKQAGIEFVWQFDYRDFSFLSPADTSGLFGNLLDNALAACRKVTQNPYIHMETCQNNEFINIAVSNSHAGTVQMKSGAYLSSRRSYTRTGHGIAIMKAIAKRYRGDMGIEFDCNEFTLIIWLKGKNKN